MKKLAWLIKRISVMRQDEILFRISELFYIKWMHFLYWCKRCGLFDNSINPGKYEFATAKGSQLPLLEWSFDNDESVIDQYLEGSVHALGFSWQWKNNADIWHCAPDTGNHWPKNFFASIAYRTGNPYGDIRVAWEPSRLQHLVDLALVAENTSGQKSIDAVEMIEKQYLSWCQDNPLWRGIHYISAMECGLRIIAVAHALDKVRDKLNRRDEIWDAYARMVYQHANMIINRLSMHSSTGNHTIAECSGLVYAALLFPEFNEADHWLDTGLKILNDEADHQILPDGGGVEQAHWYHLFIIDLYGLVESLLVYKKHAVPEKLAKALIRGRGFLQALGEEPGDLWPVGDSDNGYALSKYLRLTWRDAGAVRHFRLKSFDHAGYTLIRDSGDIDLKLLFDHGDLGMAPSYGHGHADALSVIINIDNEPLLIDPGTYAYTGDIDWRSYFRGTSAHNTISIDGLDQSIQKSAFMWSRTVKAELLKASDNVSDGSIMLLARHFGYSKLGITHWRGIIWRKPGHIIIWDYVAGEDHHRLEQHWQLAVEPDTYTQDTCLFNLSSKKYCMKVTGGSQSIRTGQTNPISGWKSSKYGIKEKINTLEYAYQGELPHEFITVISPLGLENNNYDDDIVQMRQWHNEFSKN